MYICKKFEILTTINESYYEESTTIDDFRSFYDRA